MKCIGCGFETDDTNNFMVHLIDCQSKPERKWTTYNEYDTTPVPFKNSEILKEE